MSPSSNIVLTYTSLCVHRCPCTTLLIPVPSRKSHQTGKFGRNKEKSDCSSEKTGIVTSFHGLQKIFLKQRVVSQCDGFPLNPTGIFCSLNTEQCAEFDSLKGETVRKFLFNSIYRSIIGGGRSTGLLQHLKKKQEKL